MADRLYRSRSDRVISGVAGGIAEQYDLDPSLVRVVWVVLAIASGGILAVVYLVMMFVVPEAPFDTSRPGQPGYDPWSSPAATGIRPSAPPTPASGEDSAAEPPTGPSTSSPSNPPPPGSWLGPDGRRVDAARFAAERPPAASARRGDPGGPLVLGVILILIGAFFLIRQYVPQVDVGAVWPVLAVAAGVVLVLLSLIPDRSRG